MDKNSSIFSFNTLKGFPWPTRVFCLTLVCVLLFAWIAPPMLEVYGLQELSQRDLGCYIAQQRNPETRKEPFVLISGASYSGFCVSSLLLADRFCDWEKDKNEVVVKATLNASYPWDTYAFLKKYERETDHIQLVVCNLHPANIRLQDNLLGTQLVNTIPSLGMVGMRNPITGEPLSIPFVLDRTQFFVCRGLAAVTIDFLPFNMKKDLLETNVHESYWNNQEYAQERRLVMQKWNTRTPEEVKAYRELEISAQSNPILIQCVWDLVQYCQERGIFLVLHRTPFIADYNVYPHGYLDPAEPESMVSECERTFFQLEEQLKKTPGVLVLDCPSLHSIGCDEDEPTLFFDRIHMTRKGAKIYTNWLCDRMLESPQIRQILDAERAKRTTHP